MIVYIIPGKTKNIQDAYDYIADEKKTAKTPAKSWQEYDKNSDLAKDLSYEEFRLICTDGFQHALNYIKNENKACGYVSGYLCHPDLAEEEFAQTKIKNLRRVGKTLEDDKGNYYYHIIQSFPKELDISDDEVHACGLELVKRLGLYQAIVASHVHPEIKEDELIHGEQKHNHIIINSHIFHEFVDEEKPYKMKYHDCNDSYAQLQLINDQIAIEHGLPIIAKPGKDHFDSRHEVNQKSKRTSWKERIRIDIINAMKASHDFDSYEQCMLASGYKLRKGSSKKEGQYITYICSTEEGEKRIRDFKLGQGYTIAELETYWNTMNAIQREQFRNSVTPKNRIEQILETTDEPLFIEFKIELSEKRKKKRHEQNLNIRNSYTNYLPLNSPQTFSHAELTYFDPNQTYNIVNSIHHKMTAVSGQDILNYYRRIQEKERLEQEEEKQLQKERQYRDYYSRSGFIKSETHEPYRIGMYDEYGLKRTLVELILILAIVIIKNEYGKWNTTHTSELDNQEYTNNPIYARKDWKVQRMMDSIRIAREEGISNVAEVDKKRDQVGKELQKSEAEIRRLSGTLKKMEPLVNAINSHLAVKDLCEKIYEMPDGLDKAKMQQLHTNKIKTYKNSKAMMYRFKVTSDTEIQDVLERFDEYKCKYKSAQEQHDKFKYQYQKLSKLKYSLQLAQNEQFCYGPAYKKSLEGLIQEAQGQQSQDNCRHTHIEQTER